MQSGFKISRPLGFAIAAAILVFALFVAWWAGTSRIAPVEAGAPAAAPADRGQGPGRSPAPAKAAASNSGAEEVRREQMAAAYAALEQDRRDLNSRLGELNADLWDVRLPAPRAAEVSRVMIEARALLKDPPLLGAFGSVADIEQERLRVQAARSNLDALAPIINAAHGTAHAPAAH